MADRTSATDLAVAGGPPPPPTPKTGFAAEVGSSGTNVYAGLIRRDYLPALNGQQGYGVFDEMRRSDGQVAAVLNVWEMPLLACQWYVEEPDDPSAAEVEHADFASHSLFEFGEQSWPSFLRECLTMLAFGFSVFEKVYAYQAGEFAGKLGLRKLAFRDQKSVWRWLIHGGNLTGIEQWGPPLWQRAIIPADKLCVFTHRKEGDNFEGISLLRPAYKHWLIKDRLYRLQAVTLERNGMGVPVGQWDGDLTQEQADQVREVVENIRVSESVGVTLPTKSVTLSMLEHKGLGTSIQAFQTAIDHHDLRIAACALAGFLNLAGGQTGSYALSADQSQLLMYALGALADYVCEQVNHSVIPQMVGLNYGEQPRYPKLAHSRIGGAHLATLGITMKGLGEAGLLTPDPNTENALREELGLPPRDEDWRAEDEAKKAAMAAQIAAAGQPNGEPADEDAGDKPGKPLEQGKLRALSEQFRETVAETAAAVTNATRKLAETGQRTGERPSRYRSRSAPGAKTRGGVRP